MKNIILTLLLLIGLVSCNSEDSKLKYSYSVNSDGMIRREMKVKNPVSDIEIEMEGEATFNTDKTAITGITKDGYIKYRDRKKELEIINENGKAVVSLQENGQSISVTSDTGKELIADAARQVNKLQNKKK
ncbi:hypothetical protein D3C87_346280 [compost metagenome]